MKGESNSRSGIRPSHSNARIRWTSLIAALVVALSLGSIALADEPSSAVTLEAGFENPPNSARPRVWWHWMNGNISKDGIEKDLEWMKRVGIGGLQNFDANLVTPQVVEQRISYMTPEWKDAFRLAATKADQLGLEMAIAASPGWSETGGPWVKPEDGMKKLVWSVLDVQGGQRAPLSVPAPPNATGAFHDLPLDGELLARLSGGKKYDAPNYYADAAVFAYPIAKSKALPTPQFSWNGQALDAAALLDEQMTTAVKIDRPTAERPTTIGVAYEKAQSVRSATVFLPHAVSALSTSELPTHLEVSTDGETWKKLVDVPLTQVPTTVSFAPVNARGFRLVIGKKPGGNVAFKPIAGADTTLLEKVLAPKPYLNLAQLTFSGEAKVNLFESKAGFAVLADYYALDGDVGPEVDGVPAGKVVDLTAKLKSDGTLDWTPPKGQWRVVRLGYSLTGKVNHPATIEATGLEVDKYDRRAVRDYLEHYLGMYRDVVGPELIGQRGVQALVTDSIEFGPSNWTPGLLDHFNRLRGYRAEPFLPALTGVIVGTRQQTDAFLYDYRRTLSDLLATEHYGTVAEVAHEHDLKVYGESHEGGRPSLGDDMQLRKYADYPMAAMWTYAREDGAKPGYLADLKGAASVAHLYGKAAVAAESMTSALAPWAHAPSDLRRVIDLEFANGINRPVIHTSVHQPVDDKKPGISLMIFGQFFTRHETWAEMARPWIDYISRSSYLLQQGKNVADIAYFHGEEAPLTEIFKDVPKRYAYDFVNADVLLSLLQVDNGDLVTPGGARYRALYLGGSSSKMTLSVLRRLAAFAEAGATIVGAPPQQSPAYAENGAEYRTLTKRLWSGEPSTEVGKGRVIASTDVDAALDTIGMKPDFDYPKSTPESEVLFVHRKLDDADIYFVNNRQARAESFEARFRVAGRTPELWRADSGQVEALSYRTDGDATVVSLELAPEDSYFVVFRKPALTASATIERPAYKSVMNLDGEWALSFQTGRGAPEKATMKTLASLSESADPGIKYFSGVTTYRQRISLPSGVKPGQPLLLDLGAVGDVAEVRVNGQLVGTVWHAPNQLDIGKAVRKGKNEIEIKVANLWVNRLIGDVQPDAKKVAYVTMPTYRADASLRAAGLIGPVRLLAQEH